MQSKLLTGDQVLWIYKRSLKLSFFWAGETFTNAKKYEEKELLYWENVNAEELLRKKEAEEREAVSHKTKETNDRYALVK